MGQTGSDVEARLELSPLTRLDTQLNVTDLIIPSLYAVITSLLAWYYGEPL